MAHHLPSVLLVVVGSLIAGTRACALSIDSSVPHVALPHASALSTRFYDLGGRTNSVLRIGGQRFYLGVPPPFCLGGEGLVDGRIASPLPILCGYVPLSECHQDPRTSRMDPLTSL